MLKPRLDRIDQPQCGNVSEGIDQRIFEVFGIVILRRQIVGIARRQIGADNPYGPPIGIFNNRLVSSFHEVIEARATGRNVGYQGLTFHREHVRSLAMSPVSNRIPDPVRRQIRRVAVSRTT